MVNDYSCPYSQTDQLPKTLLTMLTLFLDPITTLLLDQIQSQLPVLCDEQPVVALLHPILHPFVSCLIAVGWRLFGLCLSLLSSEMKLQLQKPH